MRAPGLSRMTALTALTVGLGFAGFGDAGCSSSSTSAGGGSSTPEGGGPTDDATAGSGGVDGSASGAPDSASPDPSCANAEGVVVLTGDLGGNALDAAFPFSEPGTDFLISAPSDGTGYNPLVGDIDLTFASFVAGQNVQIELVELTIVGSATTCASTGCMPGVSVSVGQPPTTSIATTSTDCGPSATVPIDASGTLHLGVTNGAANVGIHVQLLPQ
jgi:hypothetical protein